MTTFSSWREGHSCDRLQCIAFYNCSTTANGMHNFDFVTSLEVMAAEGGAGDEFCIDLNGQALISEVQFRNQIGHSDILDKSALVAIEKNLHGTLIPLVG